MSLAARRPESWRPRGAAAWSRKDMRPHAFWRAVSPRDREGLGVRCGRGPAFPLEWWRCGESRQGFTISYPPQGLTEERGRFPTERELSSKRKGGGPP